MDFIKVLNRHTIFEYTDLSDSEFTAWIKIMSLTAYLEKEPTREQMLKHVHHKTLSGLQDKFKKHSTTLQDILKKVLSDVQEVVKRREDWKQKKKEKRARLQNVQGDVQGDVSHKIKRREREDIEIDKKNTPLTPQGGIVVFTLPDWIPKTEWESYLKMRRTIKKPITDDGMRLAVKALERLRRGGNQPRDVLNQSILNSWQGLFELKQTGGNTSGKPWKRDTSGVEIPADALADIAEANRLGDERRKRKAQASARGGVSETPGAGSG